MPDKGFFSVETLPTLLAGKRLLSSVDSHVDFKVSTLIKTPITPKAGEMTSFLSSFY